VAAVLILWFDHRSWLTGCGTQLLSAWAQTACKKLQDAGNLQPKSLLHEKLRTLRGTIENTEHSWLDVMTCDWIRIPVAIYMCRTEQNRLDVPVFAVNFGHDYSLCFRGIRLAVVGSARDGNKHIGIPLQFFTICLVHTSNVYFKILDICNDFVHSIT
jgi:hypothetical protein